MSPSRSYGLTPTDVQNAILAQNADQAEQLARRLPQGQLVQASSVLELRVHPERLTEVIGGFLDTVWSAPATGRRRAG